MNRTADGFSDRAAEQWNGPVTDFFARELNATAIYGRESEVEWEQPGMPAFPPYANLGRQVPGSPSGRLCGMHRTPDRHRDGV